MRILPAERRRAMYAIYAFCREVDDIADGPGAVGAKKQKLAAWREEIANLYAGQPRWPTAAALLAPVERFDLPREEFLTVIDGVQTDAAARVRMQSLDELLSYCRKVAGAPGMLTVHVLGVPEQPGPRLATALGNALQLTNILRDLKEDAAVERLYVPMELLAKHGVPAQPLPSVFAHPAFARVCAELAELARLHYAEADRLIAHLGPRKMLPAVLMMAFYKETLKLMQARGWRHLEPPIRLTGPRKLWLALRHGLLQAS